MPTYEYRCPEGHDFEEFVLKISDAKSELPCPRCGVVAARRVSAGAGLLFKGSGFYITDYGKDGKKDQREKAASGGAKSTGSAEAGATAKSEGSVSAPAPAPASAAKVEKPATSAPTPKSGPAK